MPQVEPLGITGIEGVHYYVRDLERSRRFYVDRLDFREIGASGAELTRAGRQRSLAFQAGSYVVICSTPEGTGGRAARFLSRHPDGIGTVAFQVEDAERTFALLERRGGTPIGDIERFEDSHGTLKTFSITTPFGDTTFRFIERRGYRAILPGYQMLDVPRGVPGATGVQRVDHITSNFQTMMPALLWMEYVLGLSRLWDVQFHTRDVARFEVRDGSGLRSVVMWDPLSGTKFANNEPYRPNFKGSQINVFHEEHRGDGIQHLALEVKDILSSVRRLRQRGVEFMRTPAAYYDALPARLEFLGIGALDEDLKELRELEVLVDGHGHGSYLLQIFLKDSAGLYQDAGAGPFFYELIQRKGDQGFGAGNFRALFESIEREQEVLAEKGG
ncbi:MAG: 4-hydroxyphenylpyruvate dioxygenase [Polyangiaceae bacterium]|jgi:4-hydroxyphenylpyruvate dioxygenase|nr:4-hydroxyphenylpyruvate dioxygenase [Polyangiaceae bacterium]